jgi:toxin ParE1/3/4
MIARFVPSAWASFEAAFDYLLDKNPTAAERFRDQVLRSLERLERFPHIGHYIPEFPDDPFREVIVGPYRFFYCVEGETIWIVGVWHGAQQAARPTLR